MLFDIQMYFTWNISYCKVRPILSISSVWRVFKYLNRLSTPLWIITKICYVVQLAVTHMIVKKLMKRKSRKLLVIFSQRGLLRMKKRQHLFLGFYFQKRKRRWEAIDVEDAYSHMNVFVITHEFLILLKETKKDVVSFFILFFVVGLTYGRRR